MPRRLAILLALLIALGSALYFDVYDYFSSRNMISKFESSLVKLELYDKNVEEKKEYLSNLEKAVQPRTTLKEIESLTQAANLNLSSQKDGTYLIEGTCEPEKLRDLVAHLLSSANVVVQSMLIDSRQIVPVVTDEMKVAVRVSVRLVLKGVTLE
ncbi:hypothetical protein AJ81_00290 [Pseudothermotoga hypogea DSM 11164 = NBRC 106472]|uniref:General secretion pathway protein M n=1 Tax=Pseudothermotoga hypogea DSM 11164 = NBRC 106472 TaxID=1123384 RepID=A0A0X1KTG2_9THEM|nr:MULTISPECIES: hypothetical protein [Pseudothermotoga]AJC74607.1 hypothetical protein AJ81_00290 [Pseudothermotoga hypogea DSM 11164 = NBRC 106472]MBC7122047.1 hypothetical protein [Pseudothermotoga sp.]MDI6862884.1 hypothetical protein [Pseudothermotoga sp.]